MRSVMKAHRTVRAMKTSSLGASLLFLFMASGPANSGFAATVFHVTDGVFTPGEWPTATSKQLFFPFDASTGAGGAWLYVDQGSSDGGPPFGNNFGSNLYLLYDYVQATTAPTSSSFFDVFFQVPPQQTDYLVRIIGTTFTAYE